MVKSIKIFYNTETTGTNHKIHSIIQLSGIIEVNGQVVDTFNFLMAPHPKAQIEEEALKVNGRTEEEIKAFPNFCIVFLKFIDLIRKHIDQYNVDEKAQLIGFNNRAFDDYFLRYLFELAGNNFIGSYFWNDTVDTLVLASEFLHEIRHTMPSFKLKRVAQELGIAIDKSRLHDGLYDAELTREIYRRLTGRSEPGFKKYCYYYDYDKMLYFKSLDFDLAENHIAEVDYFTYRRELHRRKETDGPAKIYDSLMGCFQTEIKQPYHFYVHPESDSVFKTLEPLDLLNEDPLLEEVPYDVYLGWLTRLGLEDGPDRIHDELMG